MIDVNRTSGYVTGSWIMETLNPVILRKNKNEIYHECVFVMVVWVSYFLSAWLWLSIGRFIRKHYLVVLRYLSMMTLSNGNIFLNTRPLRGEFTGHRWIPLKRPETRSFDAILDLRLNTRLSKPSIRQWFQTPSHSLWHDDNDHICFYISVMYHVNFHINRRVVCEQKRLNINAFTNPRGAHLCTKPLTQGTCIRDPININCMFYNQCRYA